MVLLVNSCSKGADKHRWKNQAKPDLRKIRKGGKIYAGSAKTCLCSENVGDIRTTKSLRSGFYKPTP
jgi:hypothetical protein